MPGCCFPPNCKLLKTLSGKHQTPGGDVDEKPFICLDTEGDHFNTSNGILHNYRLSDPRRIRRMKFEKWADKHPRLFWLFVYTWMTVMAVTVGGWFTFCIISPHPPMTEQEKLHDAELSYYLDREDYSP